MSWKLTRTKQCAKCPWKVSTNPFDIPDGYSVDKHCALKETIAEPGSIIGNGRAMACHHSDGNDQMYCIGWIVNQIGQGNNIPLRIQLLSCENRNEIEVFGEQHERFEDTLPC